MNRSLIIIAGVFALIGLIVNVSFDRDNVYDMYAAGLWVLTLVFILLGTFVGSGPKSAGMPPQPTSS